MVSIVLDTCALLAFLRIESGGEWVRDLLCGAEEHNFLLHMSEVSFSEAKYITIRKYGPRRWAQISAGLASLPISFHPVTRTTADIAADFKLRHRMSLGDCFVAALAKELDAHLVTSDQEFQSIDGEITIQWLKRELE